VLEALYQERALLDASALSSLVLALHELSPTDSRIDELVSRLAWFVVQTPGAARIAPSNTERGAEFDPFGSPARTHALVTLAMLRARPAHPLVSKLARGLLDLRVGGRWRNTQENAYALLAAWEMSRLERPSDHALMRAKLGETTLLDGDLSAAGARRSATLSREALPVLPGAAGVVNLLLEMRDGGPVHVRVASEWIMAGFSPRSEAMQLERTLRLADGSSAVSSAKEGQTVLCSFNLRNHVPLDYVAVTVPIPAGLEGTPNLGGGLGARNVGSIPAWVSHREVWKDRVVMYADHLDPGSHSGSVPLRAVTPGEYALPAAMSEAMYEPEVQARTTGGRFRVVAAK